MQSIFGQTTLEGVVKDGSMNEPVIGATIAIYKDGVLISGEISDYDGHYLLSNLTPGTYSVKASYIGFTPKQYDGVIVKADKANQLDFDMSAGVLIDEVVIVDYKVPLIEVDGGTVGATVTSENIKQMAVKNIQKIAASSAGVSTQDGSDDVSIRGGRSGATEYYLDGIKMRGNLPPSTEIEQMEVITGGIEAKYGDVIGGIISLTSKGPSNKFRGGIEAETSEVVGVDGYNLVSLNLSGPILKKKYDDPDKLDRSIIGFRIAGQYRTVKEPSPSYIDRYRAPESLIKELEENPVTELGGSPIPSAQFLHNEDIYSPTIRPNVGNEQLNLSAKLDFRFSENIYATLSGGVSDENYRSSPNSDWIMYNWTNNPIREERGYRGNFSLTHKLGKQGGDDEDSGAFRNFFYTIQFGYEKQNNGQKDYQHGDNIFNYGFYGNKTREWKPVPSIISDTAGWDPDKIVWISLGGTQIPTAHQGNLEIVGDGWSDRTDINPVLSKYYDRNGFEIENLRDIWSRNMFDNVGQVYNAKWKQEDNILSGNLSFGFDLDNGAENRHTIQFGFNYEQRINRYWLLRPRKLWQLASAQANLHITGVDIDGDPIDSFVGEEGIFTGVNYPQYANKVEIDPTLKFYKEVRNLTGDNLNEYVNVDGIDPSKLRLDMFSASELNDFDLLSYYGYDYLGNKVGTNVKFKDFFEKREEGRRTQTVAPLNPIYMAGYIQDKFKFKNLIIRMGVRLDYFDANTKVMKDPYSLYEIESADEFHTRTNQQKPESVGDDYKVYVKDAESERIVGYRKGDVWFLPSGIAVDNPRDVLGSIVYPAYKGRGERILNIQKDGFDINTSFKDYAPQINVMPRLSLSFPISKDAAFFAHYDVLVQRPTSGTSFTALDYYYFENFNRLNPFGYAADNANLKPEKTIDYEVGFKKKLTETSALNVSAYYREMRNLIQRRFYDNVPAPINKYETYGNIDFGTVKGFTFTYDKRRTNNLEFKLSYTLQFAKGTGSDLNSSDGLNASGPIRNLLPLSIDERHAFNLVADYRFKGQSMGPEIFGNHIFKNSGLNVVLRTVSGRPYTQRLSPTQRDGAGYLGALSGSRLPWTFSVDAKINKEFEIVTSSANNKSMFIEIYARAQNLLNTRNVLGVYGYTGDPDDDGYLASEFGLDEIKQAKDIDVQSFLDTYSWRLAAPEHYARPRRIYVGMNVSF